MLPFKHGKHRLLDLLAPLPAHAKRRTVLAKFHGVRLHIDVSDLVGWHFAMLRSFDPEVTEVIAAAASPGGTEVFWDIGANKGACSYAIAVALPRARIVAIEPQAGLRENLVHNLQQLCPERFEHHQVGIGVVPASAQLTIPDGNAGGATMYPDRFGAHGEAETIKLVTAESIADTSRYGWPTLVKIDVEGHEPMVIQSLEPALRSHRCKVIVFENHAAERDAFGKIRELTERHGYQLLGITKSPFSTRLRVTRDQLAGVTDYVIAAPSLTTQCAAFASMVEA